MFNRTTILAFGIAILVLGVSLQRAHHYQQQYDRQRTRTLALQERLDTLAGENRGLRQQANRLRAQLRNAGSAATESTPGSIAGPRPEDLEAFPGTATTLAATAPDGPAYATGDALAGIRRLVHSGKKGDLDEALEIVSTLPDPDRKLAALKEILDQRAAPRAYKLKALDELETVGGNAAAQIVLDYLKIIGYGSVSRRASEVLAATADAGMVSSLLDAYQTHRTAARIGAAVALNQLGYPSPVTELVSEYAAELGNPDGNLRQRAVRRLYAINNPATIPYLIQALQDSNSRTQRIAIRGLAEYGDPRALPYLESLAQNTTGATRNTARKAIERITGTDFNGRKN